MKFRAIVLCLLLCLPATARADTDVTTTYVERDFSSLLKPRSPFLGFVGRDYRKLDITFSSVRQDRGNPWRYHITGTAKTGGVSRHLDGELMVTHVVLYSDMHFGVDDAYVDAGIQSEGELLATYNLTQDDGGQYAGRMHLYWYIDKNGRLRYDDILADSDSYNNNQYEGDYITRTVSEVANWGEYRIPDSGDLDIGAAEFAANPKYHDKGW